MITLDELKFIQTCAPAAMQAEQVTGIPAQITIAQAILESGWGKTKLAIMCNNLFGIKANQQEIAAHEYREFDTKEQEGASLKVIRALFAQYKSLDDCFAHHAALLQSSHYAAAMAVAKDPSEFAYMLGPKTEQHPNACTYSTLVEYHDRLMAVVAQFNLSQYHCQAPSPAPQA